MSVHDGQAAFAPQVLDFLQAWSASLRILADSAGGEVLALSYWLRRANLLAIAARYPEPRRGRGLVFHIPPSNVPTQFAYSWAVSLLAGNANVVRLSSLRPRQVTNDLLDSLRGLLAQPDFAALRQRNEFLIYGHDEDTNRRLMARADATMLWGADDTLSQLLRLDPVDSAREPHHVLFPTRHSMAMIDAGHTHLADLPALVERFLGDVLPLGQQACSSPRAILWVGDADTVTTLRQRFWGSLGAHSRVLALAREPDCAARTIEQAVFRQSLRLLEGVSSLSAWREGAFQRLELPRIDRPSMDLHPGYLNLIELAVEEPAQAAAVVALPIQTLATWPPDRHVPPGLTVLRQVPFGHALRFDVVWDGKDLIRALSIPVGA